MIKTRLEMIQFIRHNSPKHRDTNFNDYNDEDVRRLYEYIPLPPDKAKIRDKEYGIGFYLWGKLGDKIFTPKLPKWAFVPMMLLWMMINPLAIILWISCGVVLLLAIYSPHGH